MAKPVAGQIAYDTTADRPTVDLRSGRKRLLTEDDAGGTPSVHATSHQNGGSDEINVAGLNGVLADPQVAGSLDTTGAAVDVGSAAPPSSGQVLTATGATTAAWQTPSAPAADTPVTTNLIYEQHFDGTANVLPTGWEFRQANATIDAFTDTVGLIPAVGTPIVGIDIEATTPSLPTTFDAFRYAVNDSAVRPSWAYFQPSPGSTSGATTRNMQYVGYRLPSVLPSAFTVVARLSLSAGWVAQNEGNPSNNANYVYLTVSGETMGQAPLMAPVAGSGRMSVSLGMTTLGAGGDDTGWGAKGWYSDGTGTNHTSVMLLSSNPGTFVNAFSFSPWVKIRKNGARTEFFIGSQDGSWARIGGVTIGSFTSYRWIGLVFADVTESGMRRVIGIDFVRIYNHVNWIP